MRQIPLAGRLPWRGRGNIRILSLAQESGQDVQGHPLLIGGSLFEEGLDILQALFGVLGLEFAKDLTDARFESFCDLDEDIQGGVCPSSFYAAHVLRVDSSPFGKLLLCEAALAAQLPDSHPYQLFRVHEIRPPFSPTR